MTEFHFWVNCSFKSYSRHLQTAWIKLICIILLSFIGRKQWLCLKMYLVGGWTSPTLLQGLTIKQLYISELNPFSNIK